MTGERPRTGSDVPPEVARAIVDLLHAEQDFVKAWGDWQVHPRVDAKRRANRAEKKLEEAQAAAIFWQGRVEDDGDDEP
ncbi:MAG: hypothetical protein WDA16_14265 [Candidatus Thermoplasmatota archaeon]